MWMELVGGKKYNPLPRGGVCPLGESFQRNNFLTLSPFVGNYFFLREGMGGILRGLGKNISWGDNIFHECALSVVTNSYSHEKSILFPYGGTGVRIMQ